MDEVAYPILMADQLGLTDAVLYTDHIRPAANFVVSHGPSFGAERWEEQGGYSPSTIAAEIAGLVAAAHIADVNGDGASAAIWRGTADDWQRSIKGWTVTTNGPLATHPYFIRLSKTGDPNAAISYNVGQRRPDTRPTGRHRRRLPRADAARRAVRVRPGRARVSADRRRDDRQQHTERNRVASVQRRRLRRRGGQRPSVGTDRVGTGHLWPALSAERAEQSLQTGDGAAAASLLDSMDRFGSGVGLIPEQDWELPDLAASNFGTPPDLASIGFRDGGPAGSAAPLTWSAASFVRLARDVATGTLTDRPAATYDRYVAHAQGTTELTVTHPPTGRP